MINQILVTVLSGGGPSDTTAPTVTITCAQSGPTSTSPLNFTFTWSEDVTGFTVGDITAAISGGSVAKSNFATVSASVYTCDLAPSVSGTMTVDINAGVCTDLAGNPNSAATQFTISVIVYTILDRFTTNASAPLTSPRTCEPTGQVTITDTNSKLSIASNALAGASGAAGTYDWRVIGSAIARSTGLAFGVDYKPTSGTNVANFGFCNNSAGNNEGYFIGLAERVNTQNLQMPYSLSNICLGVTSQPNNTRLVIVLTATRSYLIAKTLSFSNGLNLTEYSLLAVPRHNAPANVYPVMAERSNTEVCTIDNLAVAQLPAPYTSEFGLATGYSASPASGDTLTHTADGNAEITWTATTGATMDLVVRRTDDNNCWIVRADQAGGTIKIFEKNNGTETERGSSAQTWTNATVYSIQVQHYGNNIYTFVASGSLWEYYAKASYTSASFNNTAAGAKIIASAGALANFATYPRVLSGTALSVLQNF